MTFDELKLKLKPGILLKSKVRYAFAKPGEIVMVLEIIDSDFPHPYHLDGFNEKWVSFNGLIPVGQIEKFSVPIHRFLEEWEIINNAQTPKDGNQVGTESQL